MSNKFDSLNRTDMIFTAFSTTASIKKLIAETDVENMSAEEFRSLIVFLLQETQDKIRETLINKVGQEEFDKVVAGLNGV